MKKESVINRYRPSLTPAGLYDLVTDSFIRSEALIEESWVDGSLAEMMEFYSPGLRRLVERQIAFLQAFLKAGCL